MTDRPVTGRVLLVRHGQAMVDSPDYDRLSELGRRQTQLLADAWRRRGLVPTLIVDGGMTRQADTAAALTAGADSAAPTRSRDPDWAEFDYRGVLAGHRPDYADRAARMADLARHPDPAAAFLAVFRAAVARWMSGEHDGDYAEPYPRFAGRVRAGLHRAVTAVSGTPGPDGHPAVAVVVTSAGPIATVTCDLLDGSSGTWVRVNTALANCGVTEVVVERSQVSLRTLNDHAHLDNGDPSLLTYR